MPEIKYAKRTDIIDFINTTPKGQNPNWAIYGNGISSGATNYSVNETEEQYIIDELATTVPEGYKVSMPTTQKCMIGDEVFDFVDDIRMNLKTGSDASTEVLKVYKYKTVSGQTNKFKAQKFAATVSIDGDFGGDGGKTPEINYKVNLNGTPVNGSVTIGADGKPTFTEDPISG